jgi:hypothetical protein
MAIPARPKGVVPKKGQKLVNGEWVFPESCTTVEEAPTPAQTTAREEAHNRRNWLRKRAGWPALKG